MADQFRQVTTKSWGSRIIDSIKGVVMGLLLFIVSFGVLYWNEGKVNLSEMAETAVAIQADSTADAALDKKLVSVTGVLKSDELLSDLFLKPGNYLLVERTVEMYAWVERSESKSTTNTGGSETTETIYTYTKEWTEKPQDSNSFAQPNGHANPEKKLENETMKLKHATIGSYSLSPAELQFPDAESLELNSGNANEVSGFKRADSRYLFSGAGTFANPLIGDLRISYFVVPNPIEQATVFGQLESTDQFISPFYGPKKAELYRAFEGTRETAIATLATEHKILTWILRGVGFLMMWIGLSMLLGPISVFFDVLPIVGSISRGGIGLITFLIALVLSLATIFVSMILHSIVALVVVAIMILGGAFWLLKIKKTAPEATKQPSFPPKQ